MVELSKDESLDAWPFCLGSIGLHWPTSCLDNMKDISKSNPRGLLPFNQESPDLSITVYAPLGNRVGGAKRQASGASVMLTFNL